MADTALRRRAGRLRELAFGLSARQGVVGIIDQTVVSGARFVLTVLVGRLAGADELGVYAFAFGIVALGLVVQDSLMTTPYTMLGQQEPPDDRARFAGAILVHVAGFALLAAAGSTGAAAVFAATGRSDAATVALALAASVPWVLFHALVRSVAFAHLFVGSALALDIALAVVQVAGVLVVAGVADLTAAWALLVSGLAAATSASVWWIRRRSLFAIDFDDARTRFVSNWRYGRWILGSQSVRALRSLVALTTLTVVAGVEDAGVYAAASVVVLASNPVLLGLGAVLAPQTARAFATGGVDRLAPVVGRVTTTLSAIFALYLLVVVGVGEWFVDRLFDDDALSGQRHMIIVLAAAMAVRAIRVGWNNGLKAMSAQQWNFAAGMVELGALVVVMVPLGAAFGVLGIAYGDLVASALGSLLRWQAFTRIARRDATRRDATGSRRPSTSDSPLADH